jgi:hypothetical protein
MDGRVLSEALKVGVLDAQPLRIVQSGDGSHGEETALSAEETAEIEERLRSLGYLG